jgi:hypothetical protein
LTHPEKAFKIRADFKQRRFKMAKGYIICMSPNCKFSAVGFEADFKYCPSCGGQELRDSCPHCNDHLGLGEPFVMKGQKYCKRCGKPIKNEPPA